MSSDLSRSGPCRTCSDHKAKSSRARAQRWYVKRVGSTWVSPYPVEEPGALLGSLRPEVAHAAQYEHQVLLPRCQHGVIPVDQPGLVRRPDQHIAQMRICVTDHDQCVFGWKLPSQLVGLLEQPSDDS